MKRALVLALGLLGVASGCLCSDVYEVRVKSRNALLGQIQDNLENDVGPKFKRYLEADTTRPEDLRRNDWGLVVDTDRSIARATSNAVAPTMTTSMNLLPWKAK